MELIDLQYVAATVDAGNFGEAAKRLGIYASTVSRGVTRVEDELGLTIYERGRFGVRLTAGGRAIMVHVRRALGDFHAIKRAAQCNANGQVGEIRLGVKVPPSGDLICELLRDWRLAHPMVRLVLHEMHEQEIAPALQERWLDAALVPRHLLWPKAVSVPIYREPIVAALPARHKLAANNSICWNELREEVVLVHESGADPITAEFVGSLLGAKATLQSHPVSRQGLLTLVSAGFGVTLIAETRFDFCCPAVIVKPVAESNAWVDVDLTWTPDSEEAVVGKFVAFLRDQARARSSSREAS
jgi:DNA-binding transcriptional LysR family regulator